MTDYNYVKCYNIRNYIILMIAILTDNVPHKYVFPNLLILIDTMNEIL